MGKLIDKILYFFGYAPILLRTEYKTVVVNLDFDVDILRVQKEIPPFQIGSNTHMKNQIEREMFEEIRKRIEWSNRTKLETEDTIIVAELCIAKTKK
jgi:hypothetical protein